MGSPLSDAEKAVVVRWLVENVTSDDVPGDEGSTDGLLWNLVSLALHGHGYERYNYKPDQDRAIAAWEAGQLPIVEAAAPSGPPG